jgi:hypothetical protein
VGRCGRLGAEMKKLLNFSSVDPGEAQLNLSCKYLSILIF